MVKSESDELCVVLFCFLLSISICTYTLSMSSSVCLPSRFSPPARCPYSALLIPLPRQTCSAPNSIASKARLPAGRGKYVLSGIGPPDNAHRLCSSHHGLVQPQYGRRSALYKPLHSETCRTGGSIASKCRLQHGRAQSVLSGMGPPT